MERKYLISGANSSSPSANIVVLRSIKVTRYVLNKRILRVSFIWITVTVVYNTLYWFLVMTRTYDSFENIPVEKYESHSTYYIYLKDLLTPARPVIISQFFRKKLWNQLSHPLAFLSSRRYDFWVLRLWWGQRPFQN